MDPLTQGTSARVQAQFLTYLYVFFQRRFQWHPGKDLLHLKLHLVKWWRLMLLRNCDPWFY